MRQPLPPLPAGYVWRPVSGRPDAFALVLRGLHEVASAERLPDGRWLTTTNVCFAESMRRRGIAATPRQARRWMRAWLRVADCLGLGAIALVEVQPRKLLQADIAPHFLTYLSYATWI